MSFEREEVLEQVEHDVDSDGTWAISYGDMITLLLTFFILFFSINPNFDKAKALDQSLIVQLTENQNMASALARPVGGLDASIKGKNEDQSSQNQSGNTTDTGKGENPAVAWMGKVVKVGNRVLVDFPDVSFYDFREIDVSKGGVEQLKTFAKNYLPFAGKYILGIRAYTDPRPVRSDNLRYRDNLELSALRGVSAMRALQTAGIPLARMKIGGFGELQETAHQLFSTKSILEKQNYELARKVVLVIEQEKAENL